MYGFGTFLLKTFLSVTLFFAILAMLFSLEVPVDTPTSEFPPAVSTWGDTLDTPEKSDDRVPVSASPTEPSGQRQNEQSDTDEISSYRATNPLHEVADILSRAKEVITTSLPVLPANVSPEELNEQARAALVNVYCTTVIGNTAHISTGSGVFIDPRGIILTNAHIGQYVLLEDKNALGSSDCTIRTGSPASPAYDVEILYLSPSWIKENASMITKENPIGTGEHDFALLLVTRSIKSGVPLPAVFPFLDPDMDGDTVAEQTEVLLASYPAGFLGSTIIQKDLYQASAITHIKELYTFGTGSLDLFSVDGSIVAQKGSSGSGVVNLNTGKVLGIIVTSSAGDTTADRDLNAITFPHMSKSMLRDIGFSLESYLISDPATTAASFQKNVSPPLVEFLASQR